LRKNFIYICEAVAASINANIVTEDIASDNHPSSTSAVGDWIADYILRNEQ